MPILSLKPGQTAQPQSPQTPVIAPDGYKGVAVDTRVTPQSSMLAYMEGTPWQLREWFGQLLGADSAVRPLDTAGTAVNQQYHCISNLEVRVEQSLSSSWDAATGIETVTGSAFLLPFITPNKYDYFIADAGQQRSGVFQVTEIERMTFNRGSAYRIEYTMIAYLDDSAELYGNLKTKTQRELVFHRDRLVLGQESLLTRDTTTTLRALEEHLDALQTYYLRTFYTGEFRTLMVPGQPVPTHDPYLVHFVLSTMELDRYEGLTSIRQESYEHDLVANQNNLWEVLLRREESWLLDTVRQIKPVDAKQFVANPRFRTVAYSRVSRIMYPVQQDDSIRVPTMAVAGHELTPSKTRQGVTWSPTTERVSDGKDQFPITPVLGQLDAYVLPLSWYDTRQCGTALEILVRDYLRFTTIQGEMLRRICDTAMRWGRVEQFYYIPLCVLLLKTAIREMK